jgi:cell division protein FtsL
MSSSGFDLVYTYKDEEEDKKVVVNLICYANEVQISNTPNAGFIFKFEPKASKAGPLGSRKHRPCTFQFKYDPAKSNLTGEYTDNFVDDLLSDGDFNPTIGDNSQMHPNLQSIFGNVDKSHLMEKEVENTPQIDYGKDIKVMVLRDGRPVEQIDLDDDSQSEAAANEQGGKNKQRGEKKEKEEVDNGDEYFSATMFDSTFKTRKQLSDLLSNNKTPKTILRLNIIGHIICVFVLALTFIEFFIANAQFTKMTDNVNLIQLSYSRIAEIQNIVSKARDLYLVHLNINPYPGGPTTGNPTDLINWAEPMIKANLSLSSNLIQDIQRDLQIQSKELIIDTENIRLTTTNSIPMMSKIGEIKEYDLNEATRQVVTMSINLKDQVVSTGYDYQSDDVNWFFIVENCMNSYLEGMLKSGDLYVADLTTRSDNTNKIFLTIFIIAVVIILAGILALIPSMWSVNYQKQEILTLFLFINEDSIKGLYSKCEKFISNLQVGEDDDAMSENDNHSMDKNDKGDELLPDGVLGKRSKKFKNNWKTNKFFIFLIVVYGLVLEGYFIFNYYQNGVILSNVKTVVKELKFTTSARAYFYLTANTQGILLMDPMKKVMSQDTVAKVQSNINTIFELDSTIHEEHSINVGIHNNDYKDAYNNVMMLKPCTIFGTLAQPFNAPLTQETCAEFAATTLSQGMSLGLARHYENMRNQYAKYLQINLVPGYVNTEINTCLSTATFPASAFYTDKQKMKLCLLGSEESKNIGTTRVNP